MTYLLSETGEKWPRLEFEQVGPRIVFKVWLNEDTEGLAFVAENRNDLDMLKHSVALAQTMGK